MQTGTPALREATITPERRQTTDGRTWTLRVARPTDAQPLADLFAAVRAEGRWLLTAPGALSHVSEAFFIGELIRERGGLALVAEADGALVGNALVSIERNQVTAHVGTFSICVAIDWRDVGVGTALTRAAQGWARAAGLGKVALSVFTDNARAIAVYEHTGFVREGVRRHQYRVGADLRDELLMAWFPSEPDAEARP